MASLAMSYPEIIVRQHHTDQKHLGLPKQQCAQSKEGYLRYCCNQVWTKNGGWNPWNGIVRPFGATVEYHLVSSKDLSRLHHFGPKVLPEILLGSALYAGGIWKGDIMVAYSRELEQTDASGLHARRFNANELSTPMEQSKFLVKIRIREHPP